MIRKTKDGRTIRTNAHYTQFRREIYKRCGGQCENCCHSLEFEEMHVHHIKGRGLGGGKRNDIPEVVLGICFTCHEAEHGR